MIRSDFRRVAAVALVATAAAALPAAGEAATAPFATHNASPRNVALALLHAEAARDWSAACGDLTASARRAVVTAADHAGWPATTCRGGFRYVEETLDASQWAQRARIYADAHIVSVARKPDTAIVQWRSTAPHAPSAYAPIRTAKLRTGWYVTLPGVR